MSRHGFLYTGLALVSLAMLAGVIVSSWTAFGGGHMGRMHGGANTSGATVTVGSRAETIEIRDFAYAPGNLQVPVGASVTWTNADSAPHTATAKDGSWDTGTLKKGDATSITFDSPGDYQYYCTIHPAMKARLQVR